MYKQKRTQLLPTYLLSAKVLHMTFFTQVHKIIPLANFLINV